MRQVAILELGLIFAAFSLAGEVPPTTVIGRYRTSFSTGILKDIDRRVC